MLDLTLGDSQVLNPFKLDERDRELPSTLVEEVDGLFSTTRGLCFLSLLPMVAVQQWQQFLNGASLQPEFKCEMGPSRYDVSKALMLIT